MDNREVTLRIFNFDRRAYDGIMIILSVSTRFIKHYNQRETARKILLFSSLEIGKPVC